MKGIIDLLNAKEISHEEHVSGARLCSFHVGGPVRIVVRPKNAQELSEVLRIADEGWIETLLLGRGSNVVFSDDGYDGIVISLSEMNSIALENGRIRAGAGASMLSLASFAQKNGLSGLEFAHGIPGSVGGGVYMNAGAYGGEICGVMTECECFDKASGEVVTLPSNECNFGYRHSIFQENKELIVLSATFELADGNPTQIKEKMDSLRNMRMEKQPLEYPSAGSTFKRPKDNFAGKLIEEAGLKGYCVGGACVSEKHAGFVVNKGDATCSDIISLIEHVKYEVYARSGIILECEIEFISPKSENLTLSEKVKLEFMQDSPSKTCCRRALAYGMLFDATADKDEVFFDLASLEHARYCARILEKQFSKEVSIKPITKAGRAHHRISLTNPTVAKKLSAISREGAKFSDYIEFKCAECRRNFIRGVFLSRATITFNSGNSHLEFRLHYQTRAKAFSEFLAACSATPKTIVRKNAFGVYYKKSSDIENIMILLQANNAYFEIMNTEIERNIKADEMRIVNCESVNIKKTVTTAQKQVRAIEKIRDNGMLDYLSPNLLESATLRLDNVWASLSELAEMHEPPIQKSALNKRFARLMKIAEDIDKEKEKEQNQK